MTKQTKWKLAQAMFGLPFAMASVALFNEYCNFAEWSGFVQYLVTAVMGLYATTDVAHKALLAKLEKNEKD